MMLHSLKITRNTRMCALRLPSNNYGVITRMLNTRSFHISRTSSLAAVAATEDASESKSTTSGTNMPPANATKLSKEQLKKREIRRLSQRKQQARQPANSHPLYMEVVDALRFIRAAEVGRPEGQQTITLTTLIVSEKGTSLLNGNMKLFRPLKELKIAVFSTDKELLEEVKSQFNCQLVGGNETVEGIKDGTIRANFDVAFATPEIVPFINSQLGKQLGRRGILPNTKKGTVSDDLVTLMNAKMGNIPFKQTGNNISIPIGKCYFSDKDILLNIIAARDAFKEALANQKAKRPSILSKTTLSSTHGPGIVIDFV
ncbi:mitochondrial 54S ribosomal protein uL1m NDAI_0J01330 [Naumovozyma dairenensis CBS 421]|uniref:Ribosomal protein n=1 Tax=Naumovozyma dairenensis (strain ATCC 10597 / BCRC 20456 / CBS 421 / NBRC 0211 / NRRL Y-12639) TaxID=1071378 RepID=G0WGU7_NAUDC|nr:hypothetical protein NDAI_0J01330 [Naumovozyma dairenensis CBS 421]CCD27025.1 hypothetical protein NDAI_0J01330 [Naumovozyma dairenensis CBS 421]